MSVDGTDFRIQQQTPWSESWFGHKFRGPGLRYEVCVSIRSGDIVWCNGPFPCGIYPDIEIFRRGLIQELDDARRRTGRIEMVEADKGYRGEILYAVVPDDNADVDQRRMKYRVAQRHETVNKRLKQWGCLKRVFRHNIQKHQSVFDAVAVITQLSIRNGEPLFDVEYNDP
jgi:hypothetical protein